MQKTMGILFAIVTATSACTSKTKGTSKVNNIEHMKSAIQITEGPNAGKWDVTCANNTKEVVTQENFAKSTVCLNFYNFDADNVNSKQLATVIIKDSWNSPILSKDGKTLALIGITDYGTIVERVDLQTQKSRTFNVSEGAEFIGSDSAGSFYFKDRIDAENCLMRLDPAADKPVKQSCFASDVVQFRSVGLDSIDNNFGIIDANKFESIIDPNKVDPIVKTTSIQFRFLLSPKSELRESDVQSSIAQSNPIQNVSGKGVALRVKQPEVITQKNDENTKIGTITRFGAFEIVSTASGCAINACPAVNFFTLPGWLNSQATEQVSAVVDAGDHILVILRELSGSMYNSGLARSSRLFSLPKSTLGL